jgi:exopolysaccharide biosynthesis polyprenyl glycosylphosphotransferase
MDEPGLLFLTRKMITTRIRGARSLRAFMAALVVLAVFWAWLGFLHLAQLVVFPVNNLSSYLVYSLIVSAAVWWEPVTRQKDISLTLAQSSMWKSVHRALRQTLIAVMCLLVFLFLTKDNTCSRLFLLTLVPALAFALIYYHRTLVPLLLHSLMTGRNRQSTLIVGSTAMLLKHANWLEQRREQGLDFVGYLSPEELEDELPNPRMPYLGKPSEITWALGAYHPAVVLYLDAAGHCTKFLERKKLCDSFGARYLHIWDFGSVSHLVPRVEEEAGLHMFSFRAEPLQDPLNQTIKKLFDMAIALPVVLFVVPVLAVLVWIFQQLQSPGPLFFLQERSGLQGRTFKIIKFRTMHVVNPDESRQAGEQDDRVYPAARWFRKLSIDEFPQFINVLLGDMSVIGPRPHMPAHDLEFAKISEVYRVRMLVRPGITGLAQIRGMRGLVRNHRDINQRVHSDLYYVENWSVILDALILVQTIRDLIFPPRTAH